MSEQFRKNLRQFNRKERYYVVKETTKNGFELNDEFKNILAEKLGIKIPDNDVFVAMDYHLDWIYASLYFCVNKMNIGNKYHIEDNKQISGTQEDVDLIIAAPDADNYELTNIIMIEAKGEDSWKKSESKKQLLHKIDRLNAIFSSVNLKFSIKPHLVLLSPAPPEGIYLKDFPEWAIPGLNLIHIPLAMSDDLLKIKRDDRDQDGHKVYKKWKLIQVNVSNK